MTVLLIKPAIIDHYGLGIYHLITTTLKSI